MSGNVFLIEWDAAAAAVRAMSLYAHGIQVEVETEDGWHAYSRIRQRPPDAVVIDLSRKPSHGRELARSLNSVRMLRGLPVIFIDGDERNRELARSAVDDAVFTTSAELPEALTRLLDVDDRCGLLLLPA
jgi:CheY-like chemotaxis protein